MINKSTRLYFSRKFRFDGSTQTGDGCLWPMKTSSFFRESLIFDLQILQL